MSQQSDLSNLIGRSFQVKIDRLAYGGASIARIEASALQGSSQDRGQSESLVVFLDFGIPEEVVEIEIVEAKSRFLKGKITKVLKPSPDRVRPACQVYTECGGCQLQHLDYSKQIHFKNEIMREAFLHKLSTDFFVDTEKAFSFFASPKSYHYRNRIVLKQQQDRLGYFKRSTHQFLPIQDCPIFEGDLKTLKKDPQYKSEAEVEVSFKEGKISMGIPYQSFSQVNSAVNAQMIEFVQSEAKDLSNDAQVKRVLDLYGGSGNLGFPVTASLGSPKPALWIIETSAESIQEARQRSDSLSPKFFRAIQAEVRAFLKHQMILTGDLVILDPPRSGVHPAVVEALALSDAAGIIWVGCDLMTLVRDLKSLQDLAKNRWQILKVQGFDMFPQTGHFETIVVLEPKPKVP